MSGGGNDGAIPAFSVMPAKAGIHSESDCTPAFAAVTGNESGWLLKNPCAVRAVLRRFLANAMQRPGSEGGSHDAIGNRFGGGAECRSFIC